MYRWNMSKLILVKKLWQKQFHSIKAYSKWKMCLKALSSKNFGRLTLWLVGNKNCSKLNITEIKSILNSNHRTKTQLKAFKIK